MAITSFIPQVWSARLQENLQKSLIFGALCNRNYEGEITQWGDSVHINMLNDITVKTYTPGDDLDDPEQLSGTDSVLRIEHGAYYNFYLNDVDAAQARSDVMDTAMRNAAHQLAADAEEYILNVIREEAGLKPMLTMPTEEEGGLYSLLLEMKQILDANNVPRYDRKLVLAPELEAALLMDNRFITGSSEADARLSEGAVARALGFDIYISTSLSNEFVIMIPDAVTFANQITKVEAYRPEKGFYDGVKGLCLSGAKVTMPSAVCYAMITDA